MIRHARVGAVLPAVVLVLLGMTLLAHAAFLLAQRQLQVAEVSREMLRASLAAEGGLQDATRDVVLYTSLAESSAPLQRGWGNEAKHGLSAVRLTHELSWLTAHGESKYLPVPVGLGRVVWTLDPIERVSRTLAVATAGSVTLNGVSADSWWAVPIAADSLACRSALAEMSVRGAETPADVALSRDTVRLGRLELNDMEVAAAHRLSGPVTPGPALHEGGCLRGSSSNWGDPSSPISPCASWYPLIWGAGDLWVKGGQGQGMLVVNGDVTFSQGAVFRGVVLAAGDIRVEQGSSIEGLVVGGHTISLAPGTRIRGSACAAWAALQAATRLRIPILLEPGRRLYLP